MGKNHVQHQPFQAVYALCRQSETGYDIERERDGERDMGKKCCGASTERWTVCVIQRITSGY